MQSLRLSIVALVSVLAFASASRAGVIIDFQSGGMNPVTFSQSSTLTVDIYLTATGAASVSGYQFSIVYSAVFTAGSANSLVNAPTHGGAGSWTSGGPGLLLDGGDGVIGAAISASTLTTPADDITVSDGTVKIGSIKVHNAGGDLAGPDLTGCFNCDAFATGDIVIGTNLGVTTFNGLHTPEATTASLLSLGLVGLAIAGRRRRSHCRY